MLWLIIQSIGCVIKIGTFVSEILPHGQNSLTENQRRHNRFRIDILTLILRNWDKSLTNQLMSSLTRQLAHDKRTFVLIYYV